MIKLTDWESGLPIYVRPEAIVSMRRIAAAVHKSFIDGEPARELGERTRIDTRSDMFLVRETPDEILEFAGACS